MGLWWRKCCCNECDALQIFARHEQHHSSMKDTRSDTKSHDVADMKFRDEVWSSHASSTMCFWIQILRRSGEMQYMCGGRKTALMSPASRQTEYTTAVLSFLVSGKHSLMVPSFEKGFPGVTV